ncbi:hypothetical protein [Pseudomonas fluorescens]|uniref:hypothetical protein n=1 Tax=Pseudomonas fluorescens TaxID=294 RepID=UPI00163B2B18|nr:hypothetical protein [Pseudomonas fluorescens]
MISRPRMYASVVMLIALSDMAVANTTQVELGWGNITPCSRITSSGSSILGIPDTLETADQRVYVYATVDAPTVAGIQNDIQQCAVQGAAAATISAIIASPAGAMPAFQAQFESCLSSRAQSYLSLQLNVSEGQCMW